MRRFKNPAKFGKFHAHTVPDFIHGYIFDRERNSSMPVEDVRFEAITELLNAMFLVLTPEQQVKFIESVGYEQVKEES